MLSNLAFYNSRSNEKTNAGLALGLLVRDECAHVCNVVSEQATGHLPSGLFNKQDQSGDV